MDMNHITIPVREVTEPFFPLRTELVSGSRGDLSLAVDACIPGGSFFITVGDKHYLVETADVLRTVVEQLHDATPPPVSKEATEAQLSAAQTLRMAVEHLLAFIDLIRDEAEAHQVFRSDQDPAYVEAFARAALHASGGAL